MSKWAIRLFHDEPIWLCNGVEETFDTEQDAINAMEKEFDELQEDVEAGYLDDVCFEDYRIVELV
jgi:hypothetical protein